MTRPTDVRPRALRDMPAVAAAVPEYAHGVHVTGVTLDSRSVQSGDLYAALPGERTHGARFAAQAAAAGAVAILTDPAGADAVAATGLPAIVVPDPRGVLGAVSAWVYGDPAADLLMLGITGTNGKTTSSYLIAGGLAAAGHTPGIIGTTGVVVGGETLPSARTTPEAPDLHALLAVMRERAVTSVVMEVSSHALALGRVDGLVFDLAMFTNLSQDHLDFHHDMAEYFAVKAELFTPRRARSAVICVDDEWGRALAGQCPLPFSTYAVAAAAQWQLVDAVTASSGAWTAVATGPGNRRVPLSSPLPGRFNMANALGSLATLVDAGIDPATAAAGIAACPGVPGRMEPVGSASFGAFVDYAHTPDAVERAVAAVRDFCSGRVLVALGCGGDRDPGKRADMGRVASVGSDLVIVTDDNPRSEDPAAIRAAVLAGARDSGGGAEIVEIADRAAAIAELVTRAQPGDAVLVLGKGHEQGQEVDGVITPFDDRVVLAGAMARKEPA